MMKKLKVKEDKNSYTGKSIAESEAATPVAKAAEFRVKLTLDNSAAAAVETGGSIGEIASSHYSAGKSSVGGNVTIRIKTKPESKTLAAAVKSEELVCKVCGKSFRSKKSVFGHMRTHPERPYRGMSSPPGRPQIDVVDDKPNSMSILGDGEMIETGMVVGEYIYPTAGAGEPRAKGWAMGDMKGEKEEPKPPAPDRSPEVLEAACNLMRLPNVQITKDEEEKLVKMMKRNISGQQESDQLIKKSRREAKIRPSYVKIFNKKGD